jgi:hypothetical protein
MDKDEMDRSLIFFEFEMMYQGIASVRAYGAEKRMHNHFIHLIDANHRAFIMFVHSSRWLGVRLDFVAAICVTLTALLVVLRRHSIGPGLAGLLFLLLLSLSLLVGKIRPSHLLLDCGDPWQGEENIIHSLNAFGGYSFAKKLL